MLKSRPKAWRPLRVLFLTSVVLLAACGDKDPQQQAGGGMKVPVSVVTVSTAPTALYQDLPGRVEAIKEAQIRARVTGILEEINFKQGTDVTEGQHLFSIDPDTYQALRDQAAAQLQNAQADAKAAASLAQRYQILIKENAVSRQDYDNAMARNAQAQAAIAAAQANLKTAEINLGYTKVTSPINGRIGKAIVTEGALVNAAEGTQLATVQQLDRVYVDIRRPASELMSLRNAMAAGELTQDAEGAKVTALFDDNSQYDQTGELLFSGVSVDPSTGQINLRAEFANPDNILLPGMFVRVRLQNGVDEKAILVPTQAIQYSNGGATSVFVVKEGVVAAVPVKVGTTYGDKILVNTGLTAGDELIVAGFQKIGPGVPVQPTPWKSGPTSTENAEESAEAAPAQDSDAEQAQGQDAAKASE
ncbi:efflux RND transporter periplasmic adaptor subunit [Paenalcaligenes suwonensis]|uniref:efflux RND transporter periplasmic adaptor subunit n=1 Tax=Paenalcaligenes suwonensis TaxID=1202713 RepID=UPI00140B8A5E|nr:efflux RND transporter periplasmic adaptor subunit [Paenalcaligenes suwonensis]NHC62460.1 efflux RND transporter periplasmic adaptor subunit [Paenalcaligenes suwonensis]